VNADELAAAPHFVYRLRGRAGELLYRSPRRPVLRPEDLRDWIKSAPTERASA
jgi:hypothetical protein